MESRGPGPRLKEGSHLVYSLKVWALEADCLGSSLSLYPFIRPWLGDLTPLRLSFFICKTKSKYTSVSWVILRTGRINMCKTLHQQVASVQIC